MESKKLILLERHLTKKGELKKQWINIIDQIRKLEQLQIKE